jgi:hypothetical protein
MQRPPLGVTPSSWWNARFDIAAAGEEMMVYCVNFDHPYIQSICDDILKVPTM